MGHDFGWPESEEERIHLEEGKKAQIDDLTRNRKRTPGNTFTKSIEGKNDEEAKRERKVRAKMKKLREKRKMKYRLQI